MKNESDLSALELENKQLLHGMLLPDSVLNVSSKHAYKHFDLGFARELVGPDQPWGANDVFNPKNRIVVDVFLATSESKKLYFASENDLLRRVRETAADQDHEGPFGIRESIFPVRLRGNVIHLVRTGKYRTAPFSEKDLSELAFVCNVPMKAVREAVAVLPIYTPEQVDDLKQVHGRLRDSIKLALREHVRLMELTGQQMQQERLSALGSLSEGMAHHFSNLLSIILGYSSMLLDRATVRQENIEAIRKISDAAQRGRRFTEEILGISESLDNEEPAVASLHERINGTLTLMQTRLRAGIKVETALEATNDKIVALPGIIHHIAFNAITNAIESMPYGGSLSIRTENVEVSGESGSRSDLRLIVTDTGMTPGRRSVPATASDTDADNAVAPRMASLLGLVASLDGNASTRVNDDGTSVLEITLPAATAEEQASPKKNIRRRLAPSHIWVADDDSVVREMCKRVLTEDAHEVREIASGEEFKEAFEGASEPPELLIYDFGMPDVTGSEICNWLRENGHRTPVILISGYSADHPEIKKSLKLRKTFLLQKPFSFRDMSDLVTIALGETLIEEAPAAK
ncbi:MAG: response regulator [Kiritimatiellia bacterium]|jgi:CheY-like chemotaxis protein